MQAIKRMGVLYGKLGLSTDASLIERRGRGVEAAAEGLGVSDIPDLLRYVFGLARASTAPSFFSQLSEQDPTFDVQPDDREAALLAGAIVAYEMENGTELSGSLALCLVAASFGGIRCPHIDDQLLGLGDSALVTAQGDATLSPADRKYSKQPKELTDTITTLQSTNISSSLPHTILSLQELGKYAEANALAAARGANEILTYVRQLEEELRTHWWVTGGWSTDAGKSFHKLTASEAALRAGKELADKNSASYGLFAAPALLNIVIETGRKASSKDVTLAEAAAAVDRAWRSENFSAAAVGSLADLLPVTTAQGLAALSEDADDWQPRFKRLTGIAPTQKLKTLDLGLQQYRELLMLRILEG